MVRRWQMEVERPWVGMTTESKTDVERARTELLMTVDALRQKLNVPRRVRQAIRGIRDGDATRRRRVEVSAGIGGVAGIGAAVLGVVVLRRRRVPHATRTVRVSPGIRIHIAR